MTYPIFWILWVVGGEGHWLENKFLAWWVVKTSQSSWLAQMPVSRLVRPLPYIPPKQSLSFSHLLKELPFNN